MGTRHILTPLAAGSPAFENNSRSWRGLVARPRSGDRVVAVVQGAPLDGHQVVGRAGDVLGRGLDAPPDRVASREPGRVAGAPRRVAVGDAVALEAIRPAAARTPAAPGRAHPRSAPLRRRRAAWPPSRKASSELWCERPDPPCPPEGWRNGRPAMLVRQFCRGCARLRAAEAL